ncbi:MAG: hypothetical protein L6301_00765 [Desulfobacteraceae bacterium]|nr:hypothetical protein [Candidatus Dependentiae bacterium]MCG2750359.1 hypothetical protein [Desulfobacteraceae bacterium]
MTAFRIGKWILPLVFMTVLTGNAWAAQKVLIIPAISEEVLKQHELAKRCLNGIRESIAQSDAVSELLYVPLYGAPEADKVAMGKETAEKVKLIKPNVIILIGDDAVKYIGLSINDIPMVFSYVYADPESLGLPKPNITGVLARPFTEDTLALAHQLTGVKTVAAIGRNSDAMADVEKRLTTMADDLEKTTGVRFKKMFLCDTFEEWQTRVGDNTAESLFLTDTSNIKQNGKEMTREDLTRWTVDHSKVPVFAATDADTEAGAVFAIVIDERLWGMQSGAMALKILKGTPITEISPQFMEKGALVININTVIKYELDVPYEILSVAREVYEN